jgi:hypothetical protein
MSGTDSKRSKRIVFHINRLIQWLKLRIALNPKRFLLYTVLRFFVIVTMVWNFYQGAYENVMLCLLALFLFLVPALAEESLHIEIPAMFESIIYLFIYAAAILGEIQHYYILIPGWDTMLHTMNGFLCAAVGFSLVDLLNRQSHHIRLSPVYVAVAAFCFSMTVGVLWEFFEFAADMLFDMDMQNDTIIHSFGTVKLTSATTQRLLKIKDIAKTVIYTADGQTVTVAGGYLDIGIIDTMKDLFVNMIGAISFCVIGYNYIVKRPENSIAPAFGIRPVSPVEKRILAREAHEVLKEDTSNKTASFWHKKRDALAARLEAILPPQPEGYNVIIATWTAILLCIAEFILLFPVGNFAINFLFIAAHLGMLGSLLTFWASDVERHRKEGLWLWTWLCALSCLLTLYKWMQLERATYAEICIFIGSITIDLFMPLILWQLWRKNSKA